jgi:hypothetical protein
MDILITSSPVTSPSRLREMDSKRGSTTVRQMLESRAVPSNLGTKVAEKYAFSSPYREQLNPSAEFSRIETSAKSAGLLAPSAREVRRTKFGWRRERDSNCRYARSARDDSMAILIHPKMSTRVPAPQRGTTLASKKDHLKNRFSLGLLKR